MPAWTRETLLEAAKQSYPNLKACFVEPLVDLWLANPDTFKAIVRNEIKRETKAKNRTAPEPKQSLFEDAVRVGRAENVDPEPEQKSTGVIVTEDAEDDKGLA